MNKLFKKFSVLLAVISICLLSGSVTNVKTEVETTEQLVAPFGIVNDKLFNDLKRNEESYLISKMSFDEARLYLLDKFGNENKSFTKILDKGTKILESQWHYKDGSNAWHLGNDYSGKRGDNLYAPLNGYVLKADDSCSKNGSINNHEGKYMQAGGNQIYMITELNDVVYGFIFMHCNEVYVREGQAVKQGEVLGTVGQSGRAKCNHCHLEMFYLGDGNMSNFVDEEFKYDFGCGRDYVGYSNRCSKKKSAPCILDSRDFIPIIKES